MQTSKLILSRSEDIARNLYEADIKIHFAYPGTEILEKATPYSAELYCKRSPTKKLTAEAACGSVNLAGQSPRERAERLVSIAHPQFRDELIAAAEAQEIRRRSNKR